MSEPLELTYALHSLPSQATNPAGRPWGGGSAAFHWGDLQVVLTPRAPLARAGAP
jgi:hypothetical protein